MDNDVYSGVKTRVRELLARVKVFIDIFRIKTDGFDSIPPGNIQGSLVMKPLGDDSKPILSEHFFSPDHRIECTYPGKIHYDHAIRDSMGDQRFPHFNRFVIIHAAIISTDQYPADLTGLKEFHSSRDPVIEIKIRPTTPQLRRSSQQHSHPIS